MKYVCTLICVSDMERSREFYTRLLGQTVKFDFGANVAFEAGLALHRRDHFAGLLDGREIWPGGNDAELYFEDDAVEAFAARLAAQGVELVHGLREQPWRQRVVRFFDPDRHIVEVGETMESVVRRLAGEGLAADGIARATSMPADFVAAVLAGTAASPAAPGEPWTGIVIEESLADNRLLGGLPIRKLAVTPQDNPAERWHLFEVSPDETQIARLAGQLRPGWYMHFWQGGQILVVFADRSFRFDRDDRLLRQAAVDHGLAQGIPAAQLDFPTDGL